MAVQMQISVTLAELGAASDKIDEAQQLTDAGAVVQYFPKEAHITKAGQVLSKLSVNTSALPMYVAGKLGAGSFALVNAKVVDWLEQAAATLGAITPATKAKPTAGTVKSQAEIVSELTSTAGYKPKKITPVDDGSNLVGKISTAAMAMDKVKLALADRVYQPVNGSDSDSKYFAVALSPTVKVGVRLKSQKVSFRVEGTRLTEKQFQLHLAGLGLTVSGTYASCHLAASSSDLCMKSVGALIMALNHPFNVVATDLNPIMNKGH